MHPLEGVEMTRMEVLRRHRTIAASTGSVCNKTRFIRRNLLPEKVLDVGPQWSPGTCVTKSTSVVNVTIGPCHQYETSNDSPSVLRDAGQQVSLQYRSAGIFALVYSCLSSAGGGAGRVGGAGGVGGGNISNPHCATHANAWCMYHVCIQESNMPHVRKDEKMKQSR